MYFSKSFLLIWARFPFQKMKSASLFSLIIRRSLFSPMRKYFDASSTVSVYCSQNGISLTLNYTTSFLDKKIGLAIKPALLLLLEYTRVVYFFASVEPMPPFRTPSASSKYVMPYGMKMACIKPSPALTSSVLPSLLSLVIFAKICPSLSE